MGVGSQSNPYRAYFRFWSKVDTNGPIVRPELGHCWIWTGSMHNAGYGRTCYMGVEELAHRISFYIRNGHWPTPECCHKCDNRKCVRPSHLFEGTQSDNARDMWGKKRGWSPFQPGHRTGNIKLTDEGIWYALCQMADGRNPKDISEDLGLSRNALDELAAGRAHRRAVAAWFCL